MQNHLNIPIAGLQKQSMIDYPGNITAVIFTQGCNFRCGYCHNPELVYPELFDKETLYQNTELLQWVHKRSRMLDAVCITGGEPTMHVGLYALITEIKQFGLKVKLDTNGTNPEVLQELIDNDMLDYVAMDIKAPLDIHSYRKVVGNISEQVFQNIMKSTEILMYNEVEYEFRTTIDNSFTEEDILSIIDKISGKYYVQPVQDREGKLGIESCSIPIEVLQKLASSKYEKGKVFLR